MIALGFNRREGKYAVVLDRDGVLQYGIAFRATGSFLLRWTDEGLGVIWIRSDVMGIFDDAGKCVGLYEYEPDSTFSRYANMLSQPARRAGKDSFILRNDHPLGALALNWGQLVRTDSLGNEVVLHDASTASALSTVGVITVAAFVAGCVIISLRRVRRGGWIIHYSLFIFYYSFFVNSCMAGCGMTRNESLIDRKHASEFLLYKCSCMCYTIRR